MAISRRTINSYTGIHQFLASVVDVVYGVGEVTKIAALVVLFRVPIIGKLNLRVLITVRCEKYQAKPSLLEIAAP
jgi:hypothetical protein